jgi:hypothetical protein
MMVDGGMRSKQVTWQNVLMVCLKVTDFVNYHRERIDWWNRMEENVLPVEGPQNNTNFRAYLTWYHTTTRYMLRQRWTKDDYMDIASLDDENTTYDVRGREGRAVELAPILDRVEGLQGVMWAAD